MDIVLITRDRPLLTEQCIRSMRENAADWSKHRLVVVFDGTNDEATNWSDVYNQVPNLPHKEVPNVTFFVTSKQLGVGGAKNFGAGWFRQGYEPVDHSYPEHDRLLMFSDNDMWYGPGWDTRLEEPFKHTTGHAPNGPTQLGGWRHPYHALGRRLMWVGGVAVSGEDLGVPTKVYEVDAATGNCFVIRWADWLRYGPFDSNAIGPGQSEDYALSQRIRAGGGLVATLDPPVAIHCGLVNSVGEPATGWREMEDMITKQLAGLRAEMRNDILIMRPTPDAAKMRPMGWARFENPKAGQPARRFTKLDPAAVDAAFEGARKGLDMQPRDPIVPTRKPDGIIPRREITLDEARVRYPPHTNNDLLPTALNIASGQRPFHSTRELIWYNVDRQNIPPDRVPDIVCNVGVDPLPFDDNTIRYVVIHQGLEHAGCGESASMLLDCWRVLARGGSLIITVPDMRKLAARWLGGELDTQLFMTNVYGAYMGDEADRHKWGFDQDSLKEYLRGLFAPHGGCTRAVCPCSSNLDFDWRTIPGADIARDWWVLGVEVVKP